MAEALGMKSMIRLWARTTIRPMELDIAKGLLSTAVTKPANEAATMIR
jgi:hypothetical protein